MKLIIDIPEETYNDIQSRDWKNGELIFSEEWKAIHNSIPLPKGHGDIVDIETLIDMFWDGNSMEITKYDLSVIEPIIEADKAERSERMKLIIDIPKKTFEDLRQGVFITVGETFAKRLIKYIKNGTPLPEGHGRLIDADELTKQLETMANDEWNKQVGASKGLEDAVDIVDDAQTIIEADKAERSERMTLVDWQYCNDPNDINEAIKTRDEDWEGLTSANDIISITYDTNHDCYVVFWKMERSEDAT